MPIALPEALLTSKVTSPTLHRLPNGLTIIAEQMPIEAVNLSLWLGVGSAAEADAANGVAHFLEHMIFKGTPRLPCGQFEELVEMRGAVVNAATSQDYTHYYLTSAPQDFADLVPWHIELVMNPSLAEADFERERPIILEEIRRSEDNPQRRTFSRSITAAFEQLPYRRPVLGPSEVIQQLSLDVMQQFHWTWYQPAHITAVAVGNLPVETLIGVVQEGFERAFANRHAPSALSDLALPGRQVPEPPFTTITRREYTDVVLQQARLILNWRVPGLIDLEQTYALDILASILGSGRTARLVDDLREERQLVSRIRASNQTYKHQGVFSIAAQLSVEHLDEVEALILQHVRRLQSELVTEAELSRVRTQVANRYIFGSEMPSDRAGLYGYYHAVLGDLAPALNYPDYIQAMEATDLLAAAQAFLTPDAYSLVKILP